MVVTVCAYSYRHRADRGVVTGIIYTVENSSVVVDGRILKEGDTIYGVKVVEIYQNSVKFEKGAERWTQHVGGRPDIAWKQ